MIPCTCNCHEKEVDFHGECCREHERSKIKTLRDEFACAALTGFITIGGIRGHLDGSGDVEEVSEWVYKYADAMMQARDKKN